MFSFFLAVLKATGLQLAGLFGIFFAFGFVLSQFETLTHAVYRRTIGWKGILWTAWLGTPIHEMSHVVMAKIFRHKITGLSLFQPNVRTGKLGHVDHSYNRLSIYQRIGNFFIGAAPILIGSPILLALLYFFLPGGKEIFPPLAHGFSSWEVILLSTKQTLLGLFSPEHLKSWKFWLFLYPSFAIVSHLAPSKEDRGNMWRGFFWIVLILLLVNIIAFLFKRDVTQYILHFSQYFGILFGVFTYAVILAAAHLVLASIILLPFRKG